MGGGAILGGAVNYSRGEADMGTGTGRAKARAWQVGVYAGWAGGGAFVEGYAGYGWLDYDITRAARDRRYPRPIPDGTAITAGGQAGYLFDLGGMRVGPVIGLRYANVELDGFTETGDPVLTLNVQDQETDSLVGSAGIELRGDLDIGGLAVQPYAQAAVEREFAGDARTVRYALTAAPTIVNQWVLPDRPRRYLRAGHRRRRTSTSAARSAFRSTAPRRSATIRATTSAASSASACGCSYSRGPTRSSSRSIAACASGSSSVGAWPTSGTVTLSIAGTSAFIRATVPALSRSEISPWTTSEGMPASARKAGQRSKPASPLGSLNGSAMRMS